MSIIEEFMKMAIGRYIWIGISRCEIPLIGKVEAFDVDHVMLSCELGLFVVALQDIASAHLTKQVEIIF